MGFSKVKDLRIVSTFRALPMRVYLLLLAGIVLGWYALLYIVPRPVELTYASEQSCIAQATFLPSLYREVSNDSFSATTENTVTVAGIPLVSSKTCISPQGSLEVGNNSVAIAPFGGWFFRYNLAVKVPEPPKANTLSLDKAIPVSKPLDISLSSPDILHTYKLSTSGRSTTCLSIEASIRCDIPSLKLEQGKRYDMKLHRYLMPSSKELVMSHSVQTLTATTIVDGSIKANETVYDRPQEFRFTADKKLRRAMVSLKKMDGSPVDVRTRTDGQSIVTSLDVELDRESTYTMSVDTLEAEDGSGLTEPYIIPFRLSGGPKVTGVNIGKSGVAGSARIVVTFDQELSIDQDISKLVSFSGGTATVGRSANQLTYQLQSLPLCTPFTLKIEKGIASKYGISSTEAWSYASRTSCHTVSVYGSSVQGRPLVAYYFGSSGPVTMYVGAIHGNEASSSGIMKAWIDHLEANPNLYEGKRIVVVPTINPDGIARGSRTNARGVNLNRNFPTSNWVSDINDTDGTHVAGGGTQPLSEPEASALATLTTSIQPRLLLSFHAVGSLTVGDPGGYSAGYAARYASMVGYKDATGQGGTFDYDITGAYEDWTYANRGIPSMVIELGSYGYFNFAHHRAALEAMLQ